MRLLLVEDEDFIREGVLERVVWNDYGITQVETADDGLNALAVCERFAPDIVLTDLRMPRMDGVEMSLKIREQFPKCRFIMMSGYTDVQYLKAGIALQAVRYIEKPIDIVELKDAVMCTAALCRAEMELDQRLRASFPVVAERLANALTSEPVDSGQIMTLARAVGLDLSKGRTFATVCICIRDAAAEKPAVLHRVEKALLDMAPGLTDRYGYEVLFSLSTSDLWLMHLHAASVAGELFRVERLGALCGEILSVLSPLKNFVVAVGKPVPDAAKVIDSFKAALQAAFFTADREATVCPETEDEAPAPPPDYTDMFKKRLRDGNGEEIQRFLTQIADAWRQPSRPRRAVKDAYLALFQTLANVADEFGLNQFKAEWAEGVPRHLVDSFRTLAQIESWLSDKAVAYSEALARKMEGGGRVNDILHYIQAHYHQEDLSIARIGENVYLAPTYMCGLFKEKTGKTVAEYISELRVEKAKQLIRDKSLKISEIAQRVGLGHDTYFAKFFRKHTGLTPSEYRERIQ